MLELKSYSNYILKDVSLYLKKGENLIILGENGAGKSTLAKVLTGLISSSNLYINNKNFENYSDKERAEFINYIPPNFEIYDEYMTVLEYLHTCSLKPLKDETIVNILKLLGIDNLQKSVCIGLSSGEKQLVMLSSAILHNAQITIFDELTANLDIKKLKDVFDILSNSFFSQKIIITHNLDFAYALKYNILFLQNGRVEFFDSCEEFFKKENLYKFFGRNVRVENSHVVIDL